MTVAFHRQAGCLALIAIAGASAEGCELRPSRVFRPPTSVSAGPPVRAVAPITAESEPDPESPGPPPVDWKDGPREEVLVRRLQNGMMLQALPRRELPAATVLILFGTKVIPSPPTTAQLYGQAAVSGSSPWARQKLEGAHVFSLIRNDFLALGFTALSTVIEGVLLRVLPGVVDAPLFGVHINDAKINYLGQLSGSEPDRLAAAAVFAGLFPAPHPYRFAGAAIARDRFREVTDADVRAFRDANLTTDNMMVVATGNVDMDSLVPTLDRALAGIPRKAVARVDVPQPHPSCAGVVIAVDDAGSQQTTVNLAYPGAPATHSEVAALEVLAAAAGGSIATHLNVSLRRERGLTYGFSSEHHKMREGGVFSVHGAVDPARTPEALAALDGEIEALRQTPLGDGELRLAKISAAHMNARLGGVAAAVRLAEAAILRAPLSDESAIKSVTAEQVRGAAQRYLQVSKRCIVAVGDATRLQRELRGAGLGPVYRAQ